VTAHSPTSVPATVRAVQVMALTGIDGLREGRIGAPADDDAVVIDVYSAGVAFPDLLMSRGQYQRKPTVPFVPGVEVAGLVSSAGGRSRFPRGPSSYSRCRLRCRSARGPACR